MAQKARSNTTVSYNSQALAAYVTQADLERTIDQLETTALADTGKTYIAGDQSNKLALSGNWTVALDAIFGVDAGSGTKRTAVIVYTEGANTVTYTWTSNAEIENYSIQSPANGLRTFKCDLVLSGAPTRAAA
jgi:hypothetical protein